MDQAHLDPAHLDGMRRAHERLVKAVQSLTEGDYRAPSRLPGWSRAHVLTHLAHNALALHRLATGLVTGEPGVMYPGGPEQRNAAIESGSERPSREIFDSLRTSTAALEQILPKISTDVWQTGTIQGVTREWPALNLLWMRRREVETHLVDLGIGVEFVALPADYLQAELDWAASRLTAALPQSVPLIVDGRLVATGTGTPVHYPAKLEADLATTVAWILGRNTPSGWPPLGWA
jgi:maleylpyruvate isomerase